MQVEAKKKRKKERKERKKRKAKGYSITGEAYIHCIRRIQDKGDEQRFRRVIFFFTIPVWSQEWNIAENEMCDYVHVKRIN